MVRIPITDRPSPQQNLSRPSEAEETIHHSSATGTPSHALREDEAQPVGSEKDVPDPTTTDTPNNAETTRPNSPPSSVESDPTVPPALQPVDSAIDPNHSLGTTAHEVAGPGGADVPGGDLTPSQDAGEAMQENLDQRAEEQEIGRQQQGGEVETQTKDLKPHPAHPQEGLPANPNGSENSGGANSTDAGDGSNQATDAQQGASDGVVARAATEQDERFLRLAADFENYKRQVVRREQEVRDRAVMSVLEDIFPVLDNFELAVSHAKSAKDLDSVRIGVEHILQQLRNTLKNHGIETIEAKGRKFDPLHHEALGQVEGNGEPEGTVMEEVQRGYSYKGQVLRPSRVKVSSG
ncbi:MAG: nucleotide exchange factor GrpE [Abitibacteriaceae bacterium]|nr:nucleotide exchange factor GrpE [Abditibacteriaceae bacterium]MBV9867815.1 nucleotide exchange factor GrpE [Abditibacteriaceae bacterium]